MAERTTTDLSRARIVDEAIALLDDEGASALSMRRLATRLGTSTMATYHHVADKDDLIDAIAERIMSELAVPSPDAPWDDAIRTMAWSFRDLGLAHPAAFRLLLGGNSPAALIRTADEVVARLVHAGFDPGAALITFRTFVRYLIGSTLIEADLFGGGVRSPTERARDTEQFRFGLETLITGIRAARTATT